MNSKRLIAIFRWAIAATCLAGIVTFYRLAIHANPTTVALTFLLLILFIAANWGLRYAIVTSVVATACYNFFFLPPIGAFTVSDPQNLLALTVFLITSVFASRSSDRIRKESKEARARQAEVEVLYRLSRALLQTDELVQLSNSIPASVAAATGAQDVLFYLIEGDRIYRSGADWSTQLGTEQLKELSYTSGTSSATSGIALSSSMHESIVPLKTGVRPRGVLILHGVQLSNQGLDALGGLVSISLDRSQAIEEVTRTEAGKESERLRLLMLDSITNELRTPLASIKASVSALLHSSGMNGFPEGDSRDLLTMIDEESDRLNRLVAQAVEMAQLDTQEVRMSFSPQALGDLIAESLEENRMALAPHPVTVKVPPDLPRVSADPVWILKLLGHMLENAATYSEAGRPIFVSADLQGDFVSCSVADRGMGIDPMEQALIFDKFYRARNRAGHTSGTGMGLAICRAIVEGHGGTITVTSQPDQGSVFTFTLPRETERSTFPAGA